MPITIFKKMPIRQEKQEIFLLKLIFHWRFHFSRSQGGIDLILAGGRGWEDRGGHVY